MRQMRCNSGVERGNVLTTPEFAYDAHGNTTKLSDQSLAFDTANRHLSTTITTVDGPTTVSY